MSVAVRHLGLLWALSAITGCASLWTGTTVFKDNPLFQPRPDELSASVYVVRPITERSMGVSDNAVRIDVGGQPLMELAKGEYTLVYLRPGQLSVRVTSLAIVGARSELREISRSRTLSFSPGQTYFLLIEPVDGEFRGVHFLARNIDLAAAKSLVRELHAVGAARDIPLSEL